MSNGDGEVTVSGDPTPAAPGGDPGDVGGDVGGAPDDQEMPLADHVEEMVRRIAVVVVIMGIVSALTFPFADRLINFLWFSFLPGSPANCPPPGPTVSLAGGSPQTAVGAVWQSVIPGAPIDVAPADTSNAAACPRLYHPLSLILARLKVASLVGLVLALPVFVYETYLFMRPGLYPNERRYYLASVPTSLVLAGIGLVFAYFLVLPLIFTYFLGYSQPVAQVAFGLSDTFGLILLMLGMFAVIFQIPLFVMLAIMMGVTSRRWLESRRLYFWAAFAGIAFLFSPDPTGMAPFVVAITMIVLFEGTLLLLRWSGAGSMSPGPAQIAGLRPIIWLLAAGTGYLLGPAPLPEGYYDDLPGVLTGVLEAAGVPGAAPIVVGLGLIVAFELLAYLLRRIQAPRQVRFVVGRLRAPVWILSAVTGYFANPVPALAGALDVTVLTTPAAAALAVLVLVLYEGGLAAWRWQQSRR
jgi:sec-independent protein translocase protein TatC